MSVNVIRPCVRSALGRSQALLRQCRTSIAVNPSTCVATPIVRPFSSTNVCNAKPSDADSASSSSLKSSSVSASEVSHFTDLASSWWDPHGPSRLLHLMNPLRHDFIKSCLQSPEYTRSTSQTEAERREESKPAYTYLDIGCGGGIFASSTARLPATGSVVAIDPTPSVIAVAKEHQRRDPYLNAPNRLRYINCAVEDLSSHDEVADQVQNAQFDVVTTFEVLEHVPPRQLSSFLSCALSHLKPGGWLIGSTISRHPVSYVTTKLIAEAPWPIGVVPRGTHDWNQYIRPEELEAYFQPGGLEGDFGPMKIEGCVYMPIIGWKWVGGSAQMGNYFFGVQKLK